MKLSHDIKLFVVAFVLGILITCPIVYVVAQSTNIMTFSSGVYPGAPSYTVGKEGSTYYAKNAYGNNDYSGTNASYVIQSSINSLSIAGAHGGIIYFRAATYICDTTLSISSDSIWLIGECASFLVGIGVHLVFPTNINGIEINPTVNDFKIAYINLRSELGTTGTAIYAVGSPHYHIFIDNVFLYKWAKGIRINTTWWGTIQKSAIQYVSEESILLEGDTTAFTVSDCSIEQASGTAISIQGPTTRYNYITHNSIETTAGANAGVEIYNSRHNIVSENMFACYADYAIRVYALAGGYAKDNKIINNIIYAHSDRGIVISGTGTVTENNMVSGNNIYGTQVGEAIISTSANYTEISNNHIISAKDNGIMLSNNWYSSVLGNIVDLVENDECIQVYNSKYSIVSSNSVQHSPDWGIYESGTSDYNVFVGNIAINNVHGILKIGANSKVNLCYNGTVWVP